MRRPQWKHSMSSDSNKYATRPLVRVCTYCDAIRTVWPDGTERWVRPNREAWSAEDRSHGICPRCFDEVVAGLGARLGRHGTAMLMETD